MFIIIKLFNNENRLTLPQTVSSSHLCGVQNNVIMMLQLQALVNPWRREPLLTLLFTPLTGDRTPSTLANAGPCFLERFILTTEHKDKREFMGFPGGAVVESLPAGAGDAGSSPGLGGSHVPRSS